MNFKPLALTLCLSSASLFAQLLDPSLLLKPATTAWPTYNGDYSGRRFSTLDQINQNNINSLTAAWTFKAKPGETPGAIVGGEGKPGQPADNAFAPSIKATPLLVNDVLYLTTPDNTWAVDAHTGKEIWHYFWRTRGGIHIGNRGVGIYGNWVFFETPDNYLVSLDAKTGKERWHFEIADVKQEYFSTSAPIVIGNHVIIGVGGDSLDVPGFLEARDPETGSVQWKWWSEPLKKGDPGSETWPDENSMRHGGGMTWIPGTYDPDLHLYYVGTGNPNPVMAGQSRKGDDLYTCSIVALNVDTGKMAWYFQTSPHDTHDWDAAQTPILFDAEIDGQPRKLIGQANRNGYFFVLDRATGKNIVSYPFLKTLNWSKGVDQRGQPIPNSEKDPQVAGVLVSPPSGGATNWPSPSFDPLTKLFYVNTSAAYSMFYLTDTDAHPEGYGAAEKQSGNLGNSLLALDYKTGKTVWKHEWPGGGLTGLLSTAGNLLFSGDGSAHLIAFDPASGKIVWHTNLASSVSNGPETYLLDGKQYLVVGAGGTLYAFTLPGELHQTAQTSTTPAQN
jgi:alcohol dehydrogenase (cytochrome c)